MKKNLRIVSAAAAALLAVAPIAASAVSTVNADAITSADKLGTVTLNNNDKVNITPNIQLNTAAPGGIDAKISVSFSASVNGTTAVSNFTPNKSSISLWKQTQNGTNGSEVLEPVTDLNKVEDGFAGAKYQVRMTNVGLNFGSQNANKKITLTFPKNDWAKKGEKEGQSIEITLDKNGTTTLDTVVMFVTAKDYANPAIVNWRNGQTGANVTSGSIELYAGSDAGKMNVASVLSAAKAKYYAENSVRPQASHIAYTTNDELADQLKKQGISVDNGWFVAPKSFSFNLVAKADNNDAESTLPITVSVPNGKETPAAQEVTKNVTVMHIATIYDKNGKATTEPVLRAYNSVSVVAEPVTINGAKFYKLAGKDQYIKVGNIDGTKRTLKHNSYVYKSNGKAYTHKVGKKTKKVLKKSGEEVTTYGKSFMIHGSQMWRIGKNQYIKVRNF